MQVSMVNWRRFLSFPSPYSCISQTYQNEMLNMIRLVQNVVFTM